MNWKVRPFKFWVQSILPLVYDDSLSYYEVLAKVGNKLNEVIQNINSLPDKLKKYIDEKFEEFEPEVVVKSKGLVSNVNLKIDDRIISTYEGVPLYLQGGCKVGNIIYYSGIVSGSENVVLVKYNAANKVIMNTVETTIQHGNSITYDEERRLIYVTGYLTGATTDRSFWAIDPDTLEVKYGIDIEAPYRDIACLSWFEGNLYGWAFGEDKIGIIDIDNATFTPLFNANKDYEVTQDMCVTEDYYIVLFTNPNVLYLYNKEDYKLDRVLELGFTNGSYNIGEAEWVCIDGEQLYLGTQSASESFVESCRINFFKIDLYTNYNNEAYTMTSLAQPVARTTLYCDCDSNILEPDGSINRPFRTFGDAIVYAAINMPNASCSLTPKKAGYYGNIIAVNMCIGINATGVDGIEVGACSFVGCHIYANKLKITKNLTSEFFAYAENSNLDLHNIEIANGTTKYGLRLSSCVTNAENFTFGTGYTVAPVWVTNGGTFRGSNVPAGSVLLNEGIGSYPMRGFSCFKRDGLNVLQNPTPICLWGSYYDQEIPITDGLISQVLYATHIFVVCQLKAQIFTQVFTLPLDSMNLLLSESEVRTGNQSIGSARARLAFARDLTAGTASFTIQHGVSDLTDGAAHNYNSEHAGDYICVKQIFCW